MTPVAFDEIAFYLKFILGSTPEAKREHGVFLEVFSLAVATMPVRKGAPESWCCRAPELDANLKPTKVLNFYFCSNLDD